jgi:hypothetical protein
MKERDQPPEDDHAATRREDEEGDDAPREPLLPGPEARLRLRGNMHTPWIPRLNLRLVLAPNERA